MTTGTAITAVTARQVFSDRGHPGVECTVVTENGAKGVAVVTAGISVGEYEVQFAYDGGKKWGGRGVQKAVGNIVNTIGPAVIGMDAANQLAVDAVIVQLRRDAQQEEARRQRHSRGLGGDALRRCCRWAFRSTSTSAASMPAPCPRPACLPS